MASGKMDVRVNEKTGKARLRFYGVAADQLALIRAALEAASKELDTEHDTVALEGLALGYLGGVFAVAAPSKSE